MSFVTIGSLCFGFVIGWITYRTLRRKEGTTMLSDIATVIGAVGGASITAIFKSEAMFGAYSVGLAVGFFGYFVVGLIVYGKDSVKPWMGD